MIEFNMIFEIDFESSGLASQFSKKRVWCHLFFPPPPCHHVITCHLLFDPPAPSPSGDDIIYEQPLILSSPEWELVLIYVYLMIICFWLPYKGLSTLKLSRLRTSWLTSADLFTGSPYSPETQKSHSQQLLHELIRLTMEHWYDTTTTTTFSRKYFKQAL